MTDSSMPDRHPDTATYSWLKTLRSQPRVKAIRRDGPRLAGVDFSALGFQATVARLGDWMVGDEQKRVATANLDFLRLASKNAALRKALRTCDLVTADGQPLVWMSRLIGTPIPERVAGSDLAWPLLEEAATRGASVYFLGGASGVAHRAAANVNARIPDLDIRDTRAPFIDWRDPKQAGAVADDIRRSGADLLLVGLGCPKQELFLAQYLEQSGARLGIGVGATLDFLAGKSTRAPRWMQRTGLEWAHRLGTEPARLGRRYAADAKYLVQLTRDTYAGNSLALPA